MGINLQVPMKNDVLKPTITVVGVGGAGGNAVNNMIAANLEGVNFVMANTDAQALEHALTDRTIQLGNTITRGLGAGANPEIGRGAAEEAAEEIAAHIQGSNMVFITAGMGGGTGTGAAPVVARIAREQGILTVAVVTKPFQFEGTHRMRLAESGLKELQEYVDTLIIIPNQNLFRIANERTTFSDAFKMADEVLHSGVRGVTDLMVKPGLINLDFADIRTVMREMGKAMMGTGEATGEKRAVEAAEAAISNPLLDDVSLKGARAALINITGGLDMTLYEVDEAANRIREELDPEANIIFGSAFNEAMEGRMRVSVVATGIEPPQSAHVAPQRAATNPIEQKKPYLFNNAAALRELTATRPAMRPAAAVSATPESIAAAFRGGSYRENVEETVRVIAPKHDAEVNAEMAMHGATHYSPMRTDGSLALAEENYADTQTLERPRAQPEAVDVAAQPPKFSARQVAGAHRDLLSAEAHAPVRSLFQRIAEVSRSLASKPEQASKPEPERQLQVTEKPRSEAVRKMENGLEEEPYLDIPAFLRRQAN